MSLSSKYLNKKLKTQPIFQLQSLPKINPYLRYYKQQTRPNFDKKSNIKKELQLNPQLFLKKVQKSLQISKKTSSYGLDCKNKTMNIFSHNRLIPYQIKTKQQFIKQTGLKNQKLKILQDDNLILITAQKWLIYDCQTKQQIKGFKPKKVHDIASISKIFTFYTAFMIIKQHKLTIEKTQLLVLKQDEQINGTKILLRQQSIVTLKDMLYAMLMNSANNAATIIANNLGHLVMAKNQQKYFSCYDVNQNNRKNNIDYFIHLVNKIIKKFQLNDTKISNPHGMTGNVSTCYDIAKFFQQCWKIQFFRKILTTKQHIIHQSLIDLQGKTQKLQIKLNNTNKLLYNTNGAICIGGKTGQNKIGGNSLISIFKLNNNKFYIIVVYGCFGRYQKFKDTLKLHDWLSKSIKIQQN